ncbi:thymidylate synthase [Phascolarctid gammaherpesvirus 1]|uniref:Thymidylate synthase n=1 Tax=Phascolarctid gammaherpesvirus 1 TaxID=2249313 RepID=A0A3S8D7M3_9GAMA|nr:thymidylate synthase [Phascolarctid gammaherpesvirus 1]AZB49250.1 thymidylate synthase [Phascolarctid gammaherpesvirus 1]
MNSGENQYLEAIKLILDHGTVRRDRTGVGTKSIFGLHMRFDLRNQFPLLTTKKIFWRGVVEELLWFLRGCTDANELSNKGVKIWDGHGSRSYLDKVGLVDRPVGDLGPIYGFQWRHFGAKYAGSHIDYSGQGVDQLESIITTIKENPHDRRILMCAWNPADLALMALPPCHVLCQFYVCEGYLSCQMYQRSGDMGLGVPFNIASYSLLTYMVAQVTDLKPKEFILCLGDAHVYLNHVEGLKEQIKRCPRAPPKLKLNESITNIHDFHFSDLRLEEYYPHPQIKLEMVV